MVRLVLIHGMKNERQNAEALKERWHDSLKEGWRRAGIDPPQGYRVVMPYYGDVLFELTDGAPRRSGVRRRGPEDVASEVGEFESEYYLLLSDRLGLTPAEIASELPPGAIERGPANWEWVQAIARAVEKRSRLISEFALGAVPQVDGYLDRPHVRKAVDDLVRPELAQGPTVVVAHSLGSVVAYLLLKSLSGTLDVPLFATVGSPLGISAIVRRMRPIISPERIGGWVNVVDERDYVALVSTLDPPTYPAGIDRIIVRNAGDDPHAITEYLKDEALAARIAMALRSETAPVA